MLFLANNFAQQKLRPIFALEIQNERKDSGVQLGFFPFL